MRIPLDAHEFQEFETVQHRDNAYSSAEDLEKEEEKRLAREQVRREVQIKAKEAKNKPLRMLRMPDVIHRTGLSRSTIYALVADGKFPRQIKVSENIAAWLEHEIETYLEERIAERDQHNEGREST